MASADLFASPEMHLRHPNESEIMHFGVDEGVGRAFDNMDPSASAEREMWVTGDVTELLDWYELGLSELGWKLVARESEPSIGSVHSRFHRDLGESFGVMVSLGADRSMIIPLGDRHWGRVSYLVAGTWPPSGPPQQ